MSKVNSEKLILLDHYLNSFLLNRVYLDLDLP